MKFDWKRGSLGIAIVLVFIIALYITFFFPEKCQSFDCFRKNADKCSKATYVNEEPDASWGYKILGRKEGVCRIEVALLNAKEGTLDLRKYEKNSMTCYYDPLISAYPEKNLDSCHGTLKENLQTVIIEKLYKYVVDNLGQIGEELRRV